MMLDLGEQAPFTFDDIYAAADSGTLMDLFLKIDSGIIEITARDPKQRAETERALADAVEALRGRSLRKAGVGDKALCMVMAIVLEAIRQKFRR
jgi:hypothetical protein